jgi:hypothetical protein
MAAGREQSICMGLSVSIGLAVDQFGCCDMVAGI